MEEKFDIYKKITTEIVMKLAEGEIPWHNRWCSPIDTKINYKTRRSYTGINLLFLQNTGEYLTFKQCQELGGTVKKGEHPHIIYQFYPFVPEKDKAEYERLLKENKESEAMKLAIPVLRYNRVFHIDQIDGIQSKLETADHKEARNPVDIANFVIGEYKDKYGLRIDERACDKLIVDSANNAIYIPRRTQFHTEEGFYNTLFGAMAKMTLEKDRDENDIRKVNLVKEELISEIASCMVMAGLGITINETKEDTLAACSKWSVELNKDYRLIVQAAAKAQKVAEQILNPVI